MDVDLHDFLAGARAGIFHIHTDRDRSAQLAFACVDNEIAISKGRVRQTVAKRKQRRDVFLVVVAVTHKQALAIMHFAVLAGIVDIGWIILQPRRESLRQFAGRIHSAEQHLGDGVARLLPVSYCMEKR